MSVLDIQYRTITCNTCGKTVTFEQDQRGIPQQVIDENPWLRTNRIVLAANKNFSYCSDLCEVAGIETGNHNTPEPPKIVVPQGSAQQQIQAAAAAAKAREEATAAIKSGQPAKVQLS